MKRLSTLLITLVFIITAIAGCGDPTVYNGSGTTSNSPPATSDNPHEPPMAPNALVPSVMIDGTLYLMSQNRRPVIEVSENEFLGTIISSVPLSEWPSENGQANFDAEGAPYAEYGNGFVVLWNGEWTLFLTAQERLLENGGNLDAERVDLGCCVTEIAVRDTALLGENSVTYTSDDFVMTLNSDRYTYSATDIIIIWGTLEYVGDNDTIEIWHGCPFMLFRTEGGKEIDFGSVMGTFTASVLVSSVLEKGRVYHFDHQKSGGWGADDPNAEYWANFFSTKDLFLPEGEYTITLRGAFGLTERTQESASGLIAELRIEVK